MATSVGLRYISDIQARFEFRDSSRSEQPIAIELFAGVGGFRLGLGEGWKIAWSNQWEPSTKAQHASECYVRNFGMDGHTCESIESVLERVQANESAIPDHQLLTAGFPCQDYSVARVLNQAAGLVGKKGVLWWSIHQVLSLRRPRFILLENVDRLLKSPANQRGRDFAVILATLARLGYQVQWRVVNAAEYGFPQRRRRVFIVGEHTGNNSHAPVDHILKEGILARAFPVVPKVGKKSTADGLHMFAIDEPLDELSQRFGSGLKSSPFRNAGFMQGYKVHTMDVDSDFSGYRMTLGDILQPPEQVDELFFIPESQIAEWRYLKGAKKEPRIHRNSGTRYVYSEGAIAFPDPLNLPSRTILTGEGGSSPSRFRHVICSIDGRLRRLTPMELERLNGFPDDWTSGYSDGKRAFMMGNSLVVGAIRRIANEIKNEIFSAPAYPRSSIKPVGTVAAI